MLQVYDSRTRVGRFPQPGELWRLIDVHKLHGKFLLLMVQLLQQEKDGASDEDADEPFDGSLETVENILKKMESACLKLRARITARCVRDLSKKMLEPGEKTNRDWADGLREINNTLMREIEDVSFFVPRGKFAKYLDSDDPPFGALDLSKFGGATAEIAEASKCLALRRNKAVVFHLMLAMEEAIRVLAQAKQATTHDQKGKWLGWLIIANNLDPIITKMPEGPDKVAWHNANAMLKSVGNAWRNPTDHPGASYSEEETETIFNAVKGFMKALAPLV